MLKKRLQKKIIPLSIPFLFLSLIVAYSVNAEEKGQIVMNAPVLRHRVAVVPGATHYWEKNENSKFVLQLKENNLLFHNEGVLANEKDWATLHDFLKNEIYHSNVIKPIEISKSLDTEFDNIKDMGGAELILLFSFGVTQNKYIIFFRLVNAHNNSILYSTKENSSSFKNAILNGLKKIEKQLIMRAWTCEIISSSKGSMVIDRGFSDGLENGVKLLGYKVSQSAAKKDLNHELLIMQTGGESTGKYFVTSVGENYSRVIPIGTAPLLVKGDLLGLPGTHITPKSRKTKRTTTWNAIYQK